MNKLGMELSNMIISPAINNVSVLCCHGIAQVLIKVGKSSMEPKDLVCNGDTRRENSMVDGEL